MIATLKAFFAWSAVGFIVILFAAAYVGRWSIAEIKRALGIID